MNDLEHRLTDALDAAARGVPVSGDAWQQHQRRLATGGTQRRVRRLRLAGVAAAAAVAVTLGVAVLPGVGDGNSGGGSPGDGQVGREVVVVKTPLTKGQTFRLSAYLTRDGGKGLSLCSSREAVTELGSGDQARGSSVGGGGCTAEGSDEAFPYLMSEEGGGMRNLVGATGPSVVSVRAWTTDGASREVPLHALGVDGLQAFGITTTGDVPRVERLVGYDAVGGVVQGLDVNGALAGSWLPSDNRCPGGATPVDVPRLTPAVTVALYPGAADVGVDGGSKAATACLPLGRTVQGVRVGAREAVLLLAPEVDSLDLQQGSGHQAVTPLPGQSGSPWQIAVVEADQPLRAGDTITALSPEGQGGPVGEPVPVTALVDPQVGQ